MEEETKILVKKAKQAVSPGSRAACLVHIYPSGPTLGSRFTLGKNPIVLGRDEGSDIPINDESVSRRHACIQPNASGYAVVDLQSTNGTFVNDSRIALHQMQDGDYLRIGNAIYRFLTGGNLEAEYHEEIYRLTIMDALTEIYNKRYLMDFLARALSCSTRYTRPLAIAMLDIDRFKSCNDKLGHLGGDYTLRELAACINKAVRKDDLFARYGGEEFVIVMPETVREDAVKVAEHVRTLVEKHPFQFGAVQFQITISVGVAAISGESWLATSEFLRKADECLYEAKRQGRNRVAG